MPSTRVPKSQKLVQSWTSFTSWHTVFKSIKMAVDWDLKHRDLTNIKAIGTDKIAWQKGRKRNTNRRLYFAA